MSDSDSNDDRAEDNTDVEYVGNVQQLTKLVCGSMALSSLPDNLPRTLTHLDVSDSKFLTSLPDFLPTSLIHLDCGSCESLSKLSETLPDTITYLDASGNDNLVTLPKQLPCSIEKMDCSACDKLASLPDLNGLVHLTELNVSDVQQLSRLPRLPHGLLELNISSNPKLDSEVMAHLPASVTSIDASDCVEFRTLRASCLNASPEYTALRDFCGKAPEQRSKERRLALDVARKVEHESATSKVIHALDISSPNEAGGSNGTAAGGGGAGLAVVIKFMADPAQHRAELKTRDWAADDTGSDPTGRNGRGKQRHEISRCGRSGGKGSGLDPQYVVGVLASSDDAGLRDDFAEEALSQGHYPQGIVMEAGERNLNAIYMHERPDIHSIRSMFAQVFSAVRHLHEQGVAHNDLKALNVLRFASDNRLRLIDFDAASRLPRMRAAYEEETDEEDEKDEKDTEENSSEGDSHRSTFVGAKFSSGTLPPEMFFVFRSAEEQTMFEAYFQEDKNDDTELWQKVAPKKSKRRKQNGNRPNARSNATTDVKAGGGGGGGGVVVKTFRQRKDGTPIDPDRLPYDLIHSSTAVDVWALGALLFLFLAGENLVLVNRDDDLTTAAAMTYIANWDDAAAAARINVAVKDDAARDLLRKLLDPDVARRQAVDLDDLLQYHPFFNPETTNDSARDAKIEEMRRLIIETNERTKVILDNTFQLMQMGRALQRQVEQTQSVILHGIFEATEVLFPTSCVILPHKLDRESESMPDLEMVEILEDDVKGISSNNSSSSSTTKGAAAKKRYGRMAGWFRKAVEVGTAAKKGDLFNASAAMTSLDSHFYLYLVDEVTGKPVVEPPYPIVITKPAQWVGKLMPFMKA
eukprot:g5371.t1